MNYNGLKRLMERIKTETLLLHWVADRVGERQKNPSGTIAAGLNAIETDFKLYGKQYKQDVDWKFDHNQSLLSILRLIIADGVECLLHFNEDDKKQQLSEQFERNFEAFDTSIKEFNISVSKLLQNNRYNESKVVAFFRHLRNSLSHGEYYFMDNNIVFKDYSRGELTAEFSMPTISLIQITYKFSRAMLLAAETLKD